MSIGNLCLSSTLLATQSHDAGLTFVGMLCPSTAGRFGTCARGIHTAQTPYRKAFPACGRVGCGLKLYRGVRLYGVDSQFLASRREPVLLGTAVSGWPLPGPMRNNTGRPTQLWNV